MRRGVLASSRAVNRFRRKKNARPQSNDWALPWNPPLLPPRFANAELLLEKSAAAPATLNVTCPVGEPPAPRFWADSARGLGGQENPLAWGHSGMPGDELLKNKIPCEALSMKLP